MSPPDNKKEDIVRLKKCQTKQHGQYSNIPIPSTHEFIKNSTFKAFKLARAECSDKLGSNSLPTLGYLMAISVKTIHSFKGF